MGFEPTRRFPPCWFSKPVHSTTLPPLRVFWILAFKRGNGKVLSKALQSSRTREQMEFHLFRERRRVYGRVQATRPYRLTVRTAPFHGVNRGSIPRGVMTSVVRNESKQSLGGFASGNRRPYEHILRFPEAKYPQGVLKL